MPKHLPICAIAAALLLGALPPVVAASARSATRYALKQELYGGQGAKIRCKRTGLTSHTCTATWRGILGRERAMVRVRATGPSYSPVESYRLTHNGQRASGTVIVPTRRASLGLPLQLVDRVDDLIGEITISAPSRVTDDGQEYLVFPVRARQVTGAARFNPLVSTATLISEGREIDGQSLFSAGCVSVDMAAGEERSTCVAFPAPPSWQQVELGNGSETGVWAP